jgi:hypothetical protein
MPDDVFVGKLDDVSVAEILQNLHLNRASGMLDLQRDRDQRRVFFLGGEVKSAMSNVMGHKMGQYLISQGIISGQQLDAAIRDVAHGSRLGQKLVNLGFVTGERLNAALQDLVCSIVTEAMGWFQGMYRVTLKDAPVPQDITLNISTASLIFKGTLKYTPPAAVRARLPLHLPLRPTARLKQYYAELQINPHQAFLLTQASGALTAEQILAAAPGNPEENMVTLYAFVAAGLLSAGPEEPPLPVKAFFEGFQDRATGTIRKPGAASKKKRKIKWVKPKAIQAELGPEDVKKIREKILRTYQSLASMSYYDILDCPQKATQKEIHYAFMALAQFYDPEGAGVDPRFADLADKMEAIYDRMEEAYLCLVEVKNRQEYDRTLVRRGL